jgi:hypothetical protein
VLPNEISELLVGAAGMVMQQKIHDALASMFPVTEDYQEESGSIVMRMEIA